MPRTKNDRLLINRNQKILKRFDYWYNKKRLRYDDVLHKLSEEEFFLNEKTILKILRETKKIESKFPTQTKLEL